MQVKTSLKLINLTFAGMMLFVGVLPVAAQSNTPLRDRIQEAREARCQRIENFVNNRKARYQQHKATHAERYNNVKDRVQNVVSKIANQGIDVIKLNSQLQQLDTLIKNFSTKHDEIALALDGSRSAACSENKEQFEANAASAKQDLQEIKDAANAIRNFIKDNLRPELVSIKAQLQAQNN